MFYSKQGLECKEDINKLLMKSFATDNDNLQHTSRPFAGSQMYTQSSVNRSSSSGDSLSPEYFPDFPTFTPRQEQVKYQDVPRCSTPVLRRPIVGRKIFSQNEPLLPVSEFLQASNFNPSYVENKPIPPNRNTEDQFFMWQEDSASKTPPFNTAEQKVPVYELFPTDNRRFEFRTPINSPVSSKYPANVSPVSSIYPANVSPVSSNYSPLGSPSYAQKMGNMSFGTPPSPISGPSYPKPRYNAPAIPNVRLVSRAYRAMLDEEIAPAKLCTFCRKNGETPMVYTTHRVKEQIDGHFKVTCPILWSHVCATCGATGDNAHTITYCPVLRNSNYGLRIPSTTITLKNTRVKSNGKRRF